MERVVKRMADWKEKSLSQAGRELLIKSVIQSIPTYAMNCFLFPITLCQDIEKATSRFFWGSTIENRKHHWAKWDILTSPKAKGGIGFKELHYFNLAMLAKQLWNLNQHQESVSFKILKAKYFKRCDILQASMGFKPSYLWRSLMAAREIVKEGEAWRIGDGRSVQSWHDRWIGMQMMRRATVSRQDGELNESVAEFIDHDAGTWREELVRGAFLPQDANDILSLPLSANPPRDMRIWRFTKTGIFSVKSAYHAAIERYSNLSGNLAGPSVMPKGWKKIWELKTIPRVRMFVWRICTNSLPTKANLCRRGGMQDPICVLCGEEVETIDHLLLRCPKVVPVWYMSMARLNITATGHETFKNLLWSYMESHPPEFISLLAYLVWEIWRHRNLAIFENWEFSFTEVTRRAQERWGEFIESHEQNKTKKTREVIGSWEPPVYGKMKANCDIAVEPDGRVGLGYAVRNHSGEVTLAGKMEKIAAGSTTILEGLAIKYALVMARQCRLNIDIIESDNIGIVEALNDAAKPEIYVDVLVKEIQAIMREVGCSEVQYVSRCANGVAHAIAHGPVFACLNHIPEHVARILLDDVKNT